MQNAPPTLKASGGRGARLLSAFPLWIWIALAGLFGGVAGLGGFTFTYAQGFSYLSNDPQACVNCHIMRELPYVREGAVKVSDHWLRSPLVNINKACQTCHKQDEQELRNRVLLIQNNTAELLRKSEAAIVDAIDAIAAAKAAGATEEQLQDALHLQRRATFYWDFVAAENSTGFHSPQEAARVLANAIDFARQAQLAAERAAR